MMNNLSERTLRQVVVGRGNWQFCGSAAGGDTAAALYSVVGTCKRLGIDPFAYLRDLLPALYALGDSPHAEALATTMIAGCGARFRPRVPFLVGEDPRGAINSGRDRRQRAWRGGGRVPATRLSPLYRRRGRRPWGRPFTEG
jgi:hypothetical protein